MASFSGRYPGNAFASLIESCGRFPRGVRPHIGCADLCRDRCKGGWRRVRNGGRGDDVADVLEELVEIEGPVVTAETSSMKSRSSARSRKRKSAWGGVVIVRPLYKIVHEMHAERCAIRTQFRVSACYLLRLGGGLGNGDFGVVQDCARIEEISLACKFWVEEEAA